MKSSHGYIDFSAVNQAAVAAQPAIVARLIPGGKILGHEYVAFPTRNDRRPGSFKINVRTGRWADFATGDRGGDLVSLAYVENCSQSDAAIWLAQMLGLPPFMAGQEPRRGEHPRPVLCSPQRSPQTQQISKAIWAEAVNPYSTLVGRYLQGRCLDLPPCAANEAIRFHGDCPFGSEWHPAMVCLVRNILTNEPQAIHRTALNPDGTAIKRNGKTLRMSLGEIKGGAIKLDPDEDITMGLCIGETCLSGRQRGLMPVWSVINTAGIAAFPLIRHIDGLHLFRENDANGASAEACEKCARRWWNAGKDVVLVDPEDEYGDLNDELKATG
jgi:Toprim domain